MAIMRAVAQYYASLAGMTVPADRFTESHRAALDNLPAIVYERTGERDDLSQEGPGLATFDLMMTIWAATPAQADRIADQLRDAFHLIHQTTIGTGADEVLVKFCRLDNRSSATAYPVDGSADNANSVVLNFELYYSPEQPANP